jgi:hypothetical protein
MKALEIKQKSLARREAMAEMYQNGFTYGQIGAHFGITAQRVGELVRSHLRPSRYPQTPLQAELSTRAANALRSYDFHTKEEVLNAFNAGYDFAEIPNLGRKSLDEILEWIDNARVKPYAPNWDDAPPDATWACFDSQGNTYWFTEKPKMNKRP